MGKTQILGSLVNTILTDSSNNVGIGGAANASYKLQVTGTTNLTGLLTLGSLGLSIPSAGGSNQVTQFVNTNSLHSASANQNNFGFNTSNNIYFGKGLAGGLGNGGVFIWNNTDVRYYTLPNVTGTLALTSDLSAYLPLTGGTLTGALSGTSATFSGNGLFGGSTNAGNAGAVTLSVGVAGTTAGGIQLWAATNQSSFLQFGDSTTSADNYRGYVGYNHNTDTLSFGTASADKLTISSTGAATFSTSLSVPTATISSSITSPMFRVTPTGTFRVNTYGDAILGYMLRSGSWKGNAENNLAFATDGPYGISFYTNGSAIERMNISSIGVVNIGNIFNDGNRLVVNHSNTTTYNPNGYNGVNGLMTLATGDATGAYSTIRFSGGGSHEGLFGTVQNSNGLAEFIWQTFNGSAYGERMRMTSNGSLCINATSPGSLAPFLYNYNSDGSRINAAFEVSIATPGFTAIQFRNPNGAVGSININTSTVTYGGTSDYRLKEDLKDFNGLDKVSAIKVYDFKWKSSEERNEGVLAHELMSIIPYAVNGVKDDIYEDGNIKSQMVDYSKIVPVLIKAIQEQQAQIEELKLLIAAK